MKKIYHNVHFLPIIIAVALAVLIVGSGIFWWSKQNQTDTVAPPSLQTGMVQYQSPAGFRIDYPVNWRLSSQIDEYGSMKEAQRVGGNYFQIFSYSEIDADENPGAPVPANKLKIEIYV